LPANQTVILAIDERQVVDQTIVLEGNQGWGWIVNNIIRSDLGITDDTIQNCIKAQEALDAKRQELANLESKTQVAEQEQKRLIVLIQADNENANYRTRLGETEEEVRKATRETIPALNEEVEKLTEALYDALGKVALDWSPQG
jgi:plasmid maintenance system antidote protein VapI